MTAEQPNEIWKDVKGFEGLYQVSNLGRVKSLGRTTTQRVKRRDGKYHAETWVRRSRILKPIYPAYRQDMYVHLYTADSRRKTIIVKRLVAQAFLPTCSDKTNAKSIYLIDESRGVTADNLEIGYRPGGNHAIRIKCNELNEEYDSILQCAKSLGFNYKLFRKWIRAGGTTYHNYTFTLL